MDESLAPKRGDVEHSGGDSPSKKQKGGVTPPSVKPAESSLLQTQEGRAKVAGRRQQRTRTAQNQDSGDANQLVNAMAALLLRHDEQLTALTSEVTFVSYAKTRVTQCCQFSMRRIADSGWKLPDTTASSYDDALL